MKKVATILLISLFLSITFIPGVRAEGLLSELFEMIKKWFESSPLGNLFAMPVKRMEMIKLTFYPETFGFQVDDFVNITTETSEISKFKGNVDIDTTKGFVIFKESGSELTIKENLGKVIVEGMKINSLELKNMKLIIISGNWNETTENGSVMIKDFLGNMRIEGKFIELEGNVSKLIKG